MKTEMKVKTDRRQLFSEKKPTVSEIKRDITKNRLSVCMRTTSCIALLALLGISGYAGAYRQPSQTTAAPIAQRTLLDMDTSAMTFEEVKAQYESERRQEIALLDSVIDHPQTDESTLKSAQTQKTQIVERMEQEAQIRAALSHMGYEEIAAISGAQRVTLIMPEKYAQEDEQTVRIVDAVCSIADVGAQDVKIILVKK